MRRLIGRFAILALLFVGCFKRQPDCSVGAIDSYGFNCQALGAAPYLPPEQCRLSLVRLEPNCPDGVRIRNVADLGCALGWYYAPGVAHVASGAPLWVIEHEARRHAYYCNNDERWNDYPLGDEP